MKTLLIKRSLLGALLMWAGLASSPLWAWSGEAPLTPQQAVMRTVTLPAGQDPRQWARQQGLAGWQTQPLADGRQQLSFRADDSRWQQLQAQCDPANPLAPQCANDSCQQVQSRVGAGGTATWLTPRAPDLSSALAGRPDDCPAGGAAQPWQGTLPTGSDPACWRVQQLRPCQSEQTPAEYLKPHWRANQLVVLLPDDGRDLEAWAGNLGLQVLEVITLTSTGDRLVRLLRPLSSGTSLEAWVDLLGAMSAVLGVQKDLAYFTLADQPAQDSPTDAPPPSAAPAPLADPLQAFNYGPRLSAADRLAPFYDGAGVAVAVIDTGVDVTHPELVGRVAEKSDFTGRGYSADAHGTGVAAIIAAAQGNGVGAAGVAPGVQIHSYKACQPRNPGGLAAQCWSSSLIQALDAAISANIPLINMSLGGPPSPLLQRLINAASERGLLVLAAAGNGGPNARPVYPAAWPQTLAVTAVDAERQLYAQANRGDYVNLAAPGVDLITAGPQGGQPLLSGTSMATAHASGVAALLLQLQGGQAPGQLLPLLTRHADDLGISGADPDYGAGLLDACASATELGLDGELCGGAP